MSNWAHLFFLDASTSMMEELTLLMDLVNIILLIIIVYVMTMIYYSFSCSMLNKHLSGHIMEIVWTVFPISILVFIGYPSIILTYSGDEVHNSEMTIKIMAHQWYWTYEYSDFSNVYFDSRMVITESNNLVLTDMRLLDVDSRTVLPVYTNIRLLMTSSDVIHSWAVPSMGVKLDAVPGRLNQMVMNATQVGIFYGQCSEICGVNHSFMPIVLEIVDTKSFMSWMFNIAATNMDT